PHSPQVLGIKKVLWEGAELYRAACKDQSIMDKFGHGTPDDWLERNVYSKHNAKGIVLMLLIDLALFGQQQAIIIFLPAILKSNFIFYLNIEKNSNGMRNDKKPRITGCGVRNEMA
ncbi:hypothetical protein VK93_22160, partial [Chromobacterium violaceum]